MSNNLVEKLNMHVLYKSKILCYFRIRRPRPSIAFAAQRPWIQNATLRDNILSGLPMDKHRFVEHKYLHFPVTL